VGLSMYSRCAICGALVFTIGAQTILPAHAWAEPQGCIRVVGCEARHEPHASDEGTAQVRAMTSTTSTTSAGSVSVVQRLG